MKKTGFFIRPFTLFLTSALVALVFCAPAPISAEAYASAVLVRPLLVTTVTGNGTPIDYPDTDKEEITVAEVTLNPGAETGWHTHANPVYAYVLSGTLAVDYADGTGRTFATGEAVIEVVDAPHNGRAVGAEAVRLIVFYTGIQGKPNSEKVATPK